MALTQTMPAITLFVESRLLFLKVFLFNLLLCLIEMLNMYFFLRLLFKLHAGLVKLNIKKLKIETFCSFWQLRPSLRNSSS